MFFLSPQCHNIVMFLFLSIFILLYTNTHSLVETVVGASKYLHWMMFDLSCLALHRFVSRSTKPVNAISNKWTRFIYRTQKHTNFIHRIIKMHAIRIVTSFLLFIDILINYARIKMLEITIWIFVACWWNAKKKQE